MREKHQVHSFPDNLLHVIFSHPVSVCSFCWERVQLSPNAANQSAPVAVRRAAGNLVIWSGISTFTPRPTPKCYAALITRRRRRRRRRKLPSSGTTEFCVGNTLGPYKDSQCSAQLSTGTAQREGSRIGGGGRGGGGGGGKRHCGGLTVEGRHEWLLSAPWRGSQALSHLEYAEDSGIHHT